MDATKLTPEAFKQALEKRKNRRDFVMQIVEDQKFSRMLLKSFLAKSYEVHTAATGGEALEQYVTYAPDLVFLDIDLPSVDGHQVRNLIMKLDPCAWIIMVTGDGKPSTVQKSMLEGAKGYIIKPYTKEKIYEVIERFIEEKTRSPQ